MAASKKVLLCWATSDCDRHVTFNGRWFQCPTHGHLRGLSKWGETHLTFVHTSPAVIERVFEPRWERNR